MNNIRIFTGEGLNKVFDPQPDITVFELAQAMTFILSSQVRGVRPQALKQQWQDLSDDAKRHFRNGKE